MTTLITGGAGFIGSNLARRMTSAGADVVVLDDLSTGRPENLSDLDVRFVEGSITDVDAVREAMRDCDSVVHLAARGSVPRSLVNPRATHEVNASGTLNILEAARSQGAYVVFSSSSSVYGANPVLPKTELDWTRPLSPYGASKLSAEGYVLAYRAAFGMDTLALRFFNVFGPGQLPNHDYAAVIPKWIFRMQRGESIDVHGDGLQTRDFTYIDTVTSILADAVARKVSMDSPVNLALGQRRSLMDVLDVIQGAMGTTAVIKHTDSRVGDVRDSQNDPRLLREVFPTMDVIDFEDSIRRTATWLGQEFALDEDS